MNEKLILTDIDGVFLRWDTAFTKWMDQQGYQEQPGANYEYDISKKFSLDSKNQGHKLVRQFNESAWMGYLTPMEGAIEYATKLRKEGYHFAGLTSMSTDEYAGKARRLNLLEHFETAFTSCQCIETGADKDEYLTQWEPGHWWIEDKPENAVAGIKAGHKSILITHPYNKDFEYPGLIRANDWKEIYEIITG
tara:strand:+ start:16 stop:594 length:579 start_codon:yes stop_codon:yes gene_type:complete